MAHTPYLAGEDVLDALASRNVNVSLLPWKSTPAPGIDMKILMEEKETGLLTAIFRWAPGSELSYHEHVEIEQSYVLEGEFEDDEGVYTQGNFVWRPKGNRHIARSPKGCVVLCFFLKPNKFIGGKHDGMQLK